MKNIGGLIFPVALILFGVYALLTTLGSSAEQITLLGSSTIPRGLALMFGLIGLVGGGVVFISALVGKKSAA